MSSHQVRRAAGSDEPRAAAPHTRLKMIAALQEAGVPVGVAYGIWGAAGTAITAVLGSVIFDDPFTVPIVFGIGLIVMHLMIADLMNLHFYYNRMVVLLFYVNVPFWLLLVLRLVLLLVLLLLLLLLVLVVET